MRKPRSSPEGVYSAGTFAVFEDELAGGTALCQAHLVLSEADRERPGGHFGTTMDERLPFGPCLAVLTIGDVDIGIAGTEMNCFCAVQHVVAAICGRRRFACLMEAAASRA